MASRPVPDDLLPWAMAALPQGSHGGEADARFDVVAGDASNRRYFRLESGNSRYIVAEAPPSTENNEAFVAVRAILASAKVPVPAIYAVDFERGYLLLQDLGDQTLLPRLDADCVDGYYQKAFSLLENMAAIDIVTLDLPTYDETLLGEELGHFPAWFVERLLGHSISVEEQNLIQRFNRHLVAAIAVQPQVLVHRDFHSRNMMLSPSDDIALIDFQDAVVGPVSYDLVSLLRDCYVQWPAERVRQWVLAYRGRLPPGSGLRGASDEQFMGWFDAMGLQRHLKVLGVFARLYLRDDKPGYLNDLPLVIAYVEQTLEKYANEDPVMAEFKQWFQARLSPLIAEQPWSVAQ